MKTLTQCLLSQNSDIVFLMSWVPTEWAKVGKRVKIEDKGSEGIYRVKQVFTNSTMDEKEVIENSQDYRRTRKHSDI